jgi:alanine racemase
LDKRPTIAVIDTGAIRFNYLQLRQGLPASVKMMAIVKANAYGHGDVEVARVLEGLGCEFLGVALAEEGERLRHSGIRLPIVVLGGVWPGQMEGVFDLDLTPVVFDLATARLIDERARKTGATKVVHVKIDTGMCRVGVMPAEVEGFFTALKGLSGVRVEALLSHFSEAEKEDSAFTERQLAVFLSCLETIKALGFEPDYLGMANSAALVDMPETRLNLVRPGIMLYGSYPSERLRDKISLMPAMRLKTRILLIKAVPGGFPVSYGGTFRTRRESLIAILPIGYADGVPRGLSNRGAVIVNGKRAPIVGAVCMDMTMADVTDVPGVKAGDEAILIGRQGESEITVEEAARLAGTISYEILCGISGRVPRVYV